MLVLLGVFRATEDFVGFWCTSHSGIGNEVLGFLALPGETLILFPPFFPVWTNHAKVQLQLCSRKSKPEYKNKPPKEWQQWKGISVQGTIHSQTHLGSGIIKPQSGNWVFFSEVQGIFLGGF